MKDFVDQAIKHAERLGADYVEARVEEHALSSYVFKNGSFETPGFGQVKGIGIRVLVDGFPGFASTNKLNISSIRKIVSDAVKTARASSRLSVPIQFSREKTWKRSWKVKPKITFENVSIKDRISLLKDIDDHALCIAKKEGIGVPNRILGLTERVTKKYFRNNGGTEISCSIPRVLFDWRLTGRKGNDTEQDSIEKGGCGGWEVVKTWPLIEEIDERVKTLGKILKTAKKPPAGQLDLVLGNKVVGLAVHESCGHPYEADRILGREGAQAGESFIAPNMIGQRIAADIVTIVDNPLLHGSYGYYEYDDEGVKARSRALIKAGVINEFLHNRETAKKLGTSSNAAARASNYDKEPLVRMANTYMLPGDHSFEELLEGINLGIYINRFEEWNIDDRRYNMRFRGKDAWLIEKGELKGMIRRPILEITTPAFYSSIDAVDKSIDYNAGHCGKGDPMQAMPVFFGGPRIRLREVRVVK